MIQRLQSVYLLVAGVLLLLVPFTTGIVTPAEWAWHVPAKAALSVLVAIVSLVAIFLFGDRKRQKAVVLAGAILCLGLVAYLLVVSFLAGITSVGSLWPVLLPLTALLMLVLARRAIAKDIELVRSMDRLR